MSYARHFSVGDTTAKKGFGRTSPHAEAVVVGAGPYGLATASHVAARGLSVRTFGETMESWRQRMPRGMYLKSTPSASSISAPGPQSRLVDFCYATGEETLVGYRPVPIESFIRYGLWFKAQHVPEVEPAKVVHVARHGPAFTLAVETGEEILATNVILATGLTDAAYVPSVLVDLHTTSASRLVSHSSDHRDFSALAGGHVAVLGAGQSALESAALLNEAGATVEVFVRGPRVLFATAPADLTRQGLGTPLKPESPLGPGWSHVAFSYLPAGFRRLPTPARLRLVASILGPSGAWWLRERVEGRIPLHLNHRLEDVNSSTDDVALTFRTASGERRTRRFDHVIAATGYRIDVDALSFLDAGLRRSIARTAGNWPALGPFFNSSVTGLYFVGLSAAATFGPLMRFVCGTRFAARRVAAAVAHSASR